MLVLGCSLVPLVVLLASVILVSLIAVVKVALISPSVVVSKGIVPISRFLEKIKSSFSSTEK